MWDQEPQILRWQVRTWEHAVLFPKSWGETSSVRHSERILPEEITAPIYAALFAIEQDILRYTEPLPPFSERLLREDSNNFHEMLFKKNPILEKSISDVVPDWTVKVTKALGEDIDEVRRKVRGAGWSLGIPRDCFSVQYGYEIRFTTFLGRHLHVETHRSLLMGCGCEYMPPSIVRDLSDPFLS